MYGFLYSQLIKFTAHAFFRLTTLDASSSSFSFSDSISLTSSEKFESVPSDFRWQVQASDLLQHPLANPGASWNASYEIDRGDALMAAAALRVFVAAGELALAYQQGDVDINYFDRGEDPSVDPLAVFRDRVADQRG